MQFVDPKVDIAFKKIFGDEKRKHVLISFLNAIMEKDIVEVQILNPYQVPKIPELKFTVLDIKARDVSGREFIVEMQANPYKYFDKRALDYVSRAYSSQLKGGEDYDTHQPVYFIGVLNFNFFNSEEYLSRHFILNVETHEQEIRDFEFYFIELTKFYKNHRQLTGIRDKWTYFLKELDSLTQLPELLANEAVIKEAAETANRATWTKEEIEAYEYGHREEVRELKMIQQLKEQTQQIEEQTQQIEEQSQLLKKSVLALKSLNLAIGEIAQRLGIPTEEVKKLIGQQ